MDYQQSQRTESDQNALPIELAGADSYRNLGPKTFWMFVIRHVMSAIGIFFLLSAIIIAIKVLLGNQDFVAQNDYILNDILILGFVLMLVAVAIGFLVSWLEYSRFKFMLDADTLKIKRGVLTADYIAIPYRRIEAVDVKEPLLYQILGVSRITIEMTIDIEPQSDNKSDSNDEVFPAIDRDLALAMQSELTKRSNIQKMNIQNVNVSQNVNPIQQ